MASFGGTIKLTGANEYKNALKSITSDLKTMSSQMKVLSSSYDSEDKSINNLTEKNRILNKQLDLQTQKIMALNGQIREASAKYGENSTQVSTLKEKLNLAHLELNKMNQDLATNVKALDEAKKSNQAFGNQSKTSINNLKDFTAEMLKSVAGAGNLGKTLKSDLSIRMGELKTNISNSANSVKDFGSKIADTVKHPSNLGNAIKTGLINTADKIQSSTKKGADGVKEFGNEADKTGQKTLKLGDIIKANLISEGIIAGVKGLAGAMKSLGSMALNVGKEALTSFADYEQLVGGVDTLFKDSSKKVQEYANNAYKTAGLSANDYMSTVTSFSASLLQSLNGDTAKSAEVADMAITDMSDNANKMGTSMDMIQNAYQGFAKQNYTINLMSIA